MLPVNGRLRFCVFVAFVACLTGAAHAGLSGPPVSYVQSTADGKHMLVMLSPVPVADDTGDDCTLPDGQKVSLRETFPSSGLYRFGSTTPSWKADWYGQHRLVVLSEDGRYAVSINLFGDGAYPRGPLSWGIKFYDRGIEIKSHNVADLVDYPSLMEFTTSDWHYLWIDDSVAEDLDGKFFNVRTSTRATFRFDVTTGEIVEERRVWRRVARRSIAVAVGLFGGVWIIRRWIALRTRPAERLAFDDKQGEPNSQPKKRSYSLRVLFIVTTIVAVFCWTPHVATFLLSIVLALQVTRWCKRARVASYRRRRTLRLILSSVPCFPWFLCYLLSVGPFLFLSYSLRLPHDVHTALIQVVYAPLTWLFRNVPIEDLPPIGWYFEAWY